MAVKKGAFSGMTVSGASLRVRASPGAKSEAVALVDGIFHIRTTAVAEGGKANAAVTRLLARALGVAPSQLQLVSGQTSRDKMFRLG